MITIHTDNPQEEYVDFKEADNFVAGPAVILVVDDVTNQVA